jgi:hypothetical protein
LQGKGRQRQPKTLQLFYARISIHGLQGSRQNGEFGQLCTSVRQYRDRTTPQRNSLIKPDVRDAG